MNKSCEKKPTAHSQNILHVDVLYNIKRKKYKTVKIFYMWMFCITLKERNTKRFVQNWHSPSHPRQNGHDFV